MKPLILIIFLSVFSTSYADKLSDCEDYATFAENIMSLRQANTDVGKLYQFAATSRDDKMKVEIKLMIDDAYGRPLYSTAKYRQMSIKVFKNKYFKRCYK